MPAKRIRTKSTHKVLRLHYEAGACQQLPGWIASHINMYQFFGGVPALTLTDNLRSGALL